MPKRTRRPSPRVDPLVFEKLIDRLEFPLERGDVRELLTVFREEAEARMCEGDGVLRKYRRRTLPEVIEAVLLRLNYTRQTEEGK